MLPAVRVDVVSVRKRPLKRLGILEMSEPFFAVAHERGRRDITQGVS